MCVDIIDVVESCDVLGGVECSLKQLRLTHIIVSLFIDESLSQISLAVKRVLGCGDSSQGEGCCNESGSRVLHVGD